MSAKDLLKLPVLHQQDRSEWVAWLGLAGLSEPVFGEEMIIEDSHVATEAALLGQGAVLGILPFVQDDIDRGHLKAPFQTRLKPVKSYHLLTRPGAQRRPEVAAVCDWLRQAAADYGQQWAYTRP